MVEASGLCMSYGPVVALADASFKAFKGQVLGLLGPNGAGKTTTMKILTTQIVPTSGNAKVADFDIIKQAIEVRRRVGYLPETPPLYGEMEVAEYLEFVGKARGLDESQLKSRTEFVVNACGLRSVFRTPVGTLSRGFCQRVGLAQALIHDPEVLILDEPTSGLDPIQIIGIRELIKTLAHGKTVIFSTHILQEVEAIADRVVIINEGFIVADGTIEELAAKVSKTQRVKMEVAISKEKLQVALDQLKSSTPIDFNITAKDSRCVAMIESGFGGNLIENLAELAHKNNWKITEFSAEKASLEDAFRHYVKSGSKPNRTAAVS